jgi:hypothetical protein
VEEHPGGRRAKLIVPQLLRHQHIVQIAAGATQGYNAGFPWLGLVRVQPNSAPVEIYLGPFKLDDFTVPAAGPVSEHERAARVQGQGVTEGDVLGMLPELMARV